MSYEEFTNKDLLCFVFYLPSGPIRLYPQFILQDGKMIPIDSRKREEAFPPFGAIFVPGKHNDFTCGKPIVVVNIPEKTSLQVNLNKVEGDNKDDYFAYCTDIDIEPYQYTHSLPIIKIQGSSRDLLQTPRLKFDNPRNALHEHEEGMYFICDDGIVGPCGFTFDQDNILLTGGLEQLDYQVKRIHPSSITIHRVTDSKEESTVMSFIAKSDLRNVKASDTIDYFSRKQKINILIRSIDRSKSEEGIELIGGIKNELTKMLDWHPALKLNKQRRTALFDEILSDATDNYAVVHDAVCNNIRNNKKLAEKVLASLAQENPEEVIKQLFETVPSLRKIYLSKEESDKLQQDNFTLRRDLQAARMTIDGMENSVPIESEELSEAIEKIKQLQNEVSKLEKINGNIEQAENTLKTKEESLRKIEEEFNSVTSGFTYSLNQRMEKQSSRLQNKITEYKSEGKSLQERLAELREKEFGQWLETSVDSLITNVENKIGGAKEAFAIHSGQQPLSKQHCVSDNETDATTTPLSLMRMSEDANPVEVGKHIISTVGQYLKKNGRAISANDIANYLVCITQGFITTFAGKPGSGKTSLCNLLAESLGLKTTEKNTHFVDVSVGRGWASHKDFIGFYNPITEKIVKTNEDVYDALMLSSKEDSIEAPPMMIMLDEANLSPLEHYWSAFLKNSDFDFKASRKINIGSEHTIRIPEHLRFLATINHDHTTEELSPRFLDRSWVIILDTPVEDIVIKQDTHSSPCDAVPYSLLQKAFGITSFDAPSESLKDKWNQVIDEFKKLQLNVMGRSFNMVMNYVRTAKHYMTNETTALDYAIAQKVLPQLAVYGAEYKQPIREVAKLCNNLSLIRCHKILSDIAESSNMDVYQFFSR